MYVNQQWHAHTPTVFTHRDHIGCHAEWHAAFPEAKRVLHEADMVHNDHGDTSGFEMVLSSFGGKSEWTLPGYVRAYVCVSLGFGVGDYRRAHDPPGENNTPTHDHQHNRWEDAQFTMVHLPGHTPGSVFIQFQERFLFTGDSLHYSRTDGRLTGFRCVLKAFMLCGGLVGSIPVIHTPGRVRYRTSPLGRVKFDGILSVCTGCTAGRTGPCRWNRGQSSSRTR